MSEKHTNPNEHKVVSFHNLTEFGFTPAMGCMYDGRPINGPQGGPGINAGETVMLPHPVADQLAMNLAKAALNRVAPTVDPAGIPTGVPLWDTTKLENLKNSFLTELYTEEKPAVVSETDKLMARVEEYKKMVDTLISTANTPQIAPVVVEAPLNALKQAHLDKQDVIKELERRQIKHDKRSKKEDLEKLLA